MWDIKNINGKAISIVCDVTDRLQVFQAAEHIRQKVGEIDIFVSSVGIYPVQEILAWQPQELYELFDTNVMAQFWVSVRISRAFKNSLPHSPKFRCETCD